MTTRMQHGNYNSAYHLMINCLSKTHATQEEQIRDINSCKKSIAGLSEEDKKALISDPDFLDACNRNPKFLGDLLNTIRVEDYFKFIADLIADKKDLVLYILHSPGLLFAIMMSITEQHMIPFLNLSCERQSLSDIWNKYNPIPRIEHYINTTPESMRPTPRL